MAQKYIISLTSIPPRFEGVYATLETLLAQTVKPEKVILYLTRTYVRFPDYDGNIPKVPKGVEVRVVDQDFGPATKVLHAVRDFQATNHEIIFCDDDQLYPNTLAERFLEARKLRPDAALAVRGFHVPNIAGQARVHAHRPPALMKWVVTDVPFRVMRAWHKFKHERLGYPRYIPARRSILRAGYIDFFEGIQGVMVRPEFFPDAAFDIPDFARPVDDIWLSGQLCRFGHPAWAIGHVKESRPQSAHFEPEALFNNMFGGKDRYASNAEVIDYFRDTYGIWK